MEKCLECKTEGKNLVQCLNCLEYFHPKCCNYSKPPSSPYCNKYRCQRFKDAQSPQKYLKTSTESENSEQDLKICHRCKKQKSSEQVIECSDPNCKRSFCGECLSKFYKVDPTELDEDWLCFVCNEETRRKEVKETNKRRSRLAREACHICGKKSKATEFICPECERSFCEGCVAENKMWIKGAMLQATCVVCLDLCECSECGELKFREDFMNLEKGLGLKEMYPYDTQSMYQVNGFWVREINY